SSVETIVKRRSCPIGGRNWGKHGPKSKVLQNELFGSVLGSPGATGVCLMGGMVYGVDGLKIGGGGGGIGYGNCACADAMGRAARACHLRRCSALTDGAPHVAPRLSF